jgi:hypothetical protein
MARAYETHVLAAAQTQTAVDTAQTITLDAKCAAVMLGARGQDVFVTFDNSTPSATKGLVIVKAAQPIYVPLGYHADGNHNIKAIGSTAGGFLDLVQLG